MGMCRKMAAINDHFESLEDELEIRDRKIEQIAHDMNIVLTLFSKFERRVTRTEHRTQHQARSLKHLTNATTMKQDELASTLQYLSNATTTKQTELASRLKNLSNATTTKQDELASRLQNLSNATTRKQDELASSLQNLSNLTKQVSLAEAKQCLDNKVSMPIFIICRICNRVVQGTSRFTQCTPALARRNTTLTLIQTSESKLFSSHQISTNLIY